MATAPALMTMEQYLRTSYSPDVDFVDGEIEERNLGEFDHGFLQGLIFNWFLAHKKVLGALPVVEQRIRIDGDRVRICDVAVVSTRRPREQVSTTPPVICVEIMSSEDRLSRAIVVLNDYRAMGVENIWLIDPHERLVYSFGKLGLQQRENLLLPISQTELVLNVNDLFAEMDENENGTDD